MGVRELRVPQPIVDPFREHYRGLILDSLLRAAETEASLHRRRGRRLRARRAERAVERVLVLTGALPPAASARERWFGLRLRAATRIAWLATLGLLIADLAVVGIHSWTTSVADVGLMLLTLLWFVVSIEDLAGPARPSSRSSTE